MPCASPLLYDVAIAGAGPVGLFLAGELRLHGCSVCVLERDDAPGAAGSPLKRLPFGMRGLNAPTLDAFHRRGLLDAIVAAQRSGDAANRARAAAHWQRPGDADGAHRPGGHFAGIPFHLGAIDTAAWPYSLPSPAGYTLAIELAALEAVLARRASALGAEIRHHCRVDGLHDDGQTVTVQAGGETFRARWLVGCDGGRSTVRKAAGFDFAGTDPEFTGYSVEAELAGAIALRPGRHATPNGMYTYAPPGTITLVDFDGGACQRRQPITAEHVQAVLRRVTGLDLAIDRLHLAATWTDRARQAGAYRRGRVLLAGDAAHIHSPLGGQGLNLGIGDAMNLGWKLAATLRGDAPPGLLDSYGSERHPVGARVLDWSRAQVALMRPDAGARALADVIRGLAATRDGATVFAERVWGATLRYDLGDAHPLAGLSLPDFTLRDGTRAGSLLRDGRGLLLEFREDGTCAHDALLAGWRTRVRHVVSDTNHRFGLRAVLARPDGFVAWATDETNDATEADKEDNHAALIAAIRRWFGEAGQTGAG
ncbi:FAD-dependent oxidoreductase [Burkholderia sp. Ac-20379]|uniref:FAD-dependent oxidoreductase n=1 Tax=Burkholderia sp. Ac-20379 TaxID=2703900 RepID=UPI00197E60CE|nr:FAD-dependent oxidoreductase [Burkholderia sp. Ac-20379]MBN3725996.1 FAD-dependent oxidoreductase [Burkholderia sp. Ac-20379]